MLSNISQWSALPDPEQAADEHQLPDVIRIVIDDQQQLTEKSLAAAVRNLCLEIDAGIGGEPLQTLSIGDELANRVLPVGVRRGRRRLRPVVVRPFLVFLVVRVDAEVEDVALREPQ